MNKQQQRAIERFINAYNNLHKVGLDIYLHESGGYICKLSDLPDGTLMDVTEKYVSNLYDEDKSISIPVYIQNFNA